jgi:2-methylcitrate dehydratase PrpD
MSQVGASQGETLSRALVRRIRALPVAQKDLDSAERYVRDWLGSFVAGGVTEPGRMLRSYGGGDPGLEGRAFLAAALSHITETDDLHRGSTTHPACVVVPVALVLGREMEVPGERVLHSVLAGYEAMLRIGEALGPAHYRIFHNTATAGVFGAAAAAAHLLGLREEAWVWALGNAGTQAAGLWQFNEDATMSKHLHAGHAAHAGLRAALLAREGFTGPAAILEGEKGFFAGFCPDAVPDRVLAEVPGWKLPETSFKPYPSCRHTHPAIDAALELRERLDLRNGGSGALERVRISSYPVALRITDNPAPASTYAAKFSMQFCVATALAKGSPGLASFETDRRSDPAVRALLERATVEVSPELAAAYPRRWGARVEVTTSDGRTLAAERESAKGDPENGLTDTELDEKVRGLCAYGGMSSSDAEELIRACKAMPRGGRPSLLPYAGALTAAAPP